MCATCNSQQFAASETSLPSGALCGSNPVSLAKAKATQTRAWPEASRGHTKETASHIVQSLIDALLTRLKYIPKQHNQYLIKRIGALAYHGYMNYYIDKNQYINVTRLAYTYRPYNAHSRSGSLV